MRPTHQLCLVARAWLYSIDPDARGAERVDRMIGVMTHRHPAGATVVQFADVLPKRPVTVPSHPLGCRRRRIPDRVVFEHVIAALLHRSGYERITSRLLGPHDPPPLAAVGRRR